jgi:hypothetical protein
MYGLNHNSGGAINNMYAGPPRQLIVAPSVPRQSSTLPPGQRLRQPLTRSSFAGASRATIGTTPRQQQPPPVASTARTAAIKPALPVAPGISNLALGALSDELHGAMLSMRDDFQLQYDEPIEKVVSQLELLEDLVQAQASEIANLRQELDVVSLGSLRVRLLEDAAVYEDKEKTDQSVPIGVYTAGTVMKVFYPFEMNQYGLWATCKQISLTSSGLSITGGVMLIGKANSSDTDGALIEPVVDILRKLSEQA